MFSVVGHILRQLVKQIVIYSAFLGSLFLGCNESKASADVIRMFVSAEYVGITANRKLDFIHDE